MLKEESRRSDSAIFPLTGVFAVELVKIMTQAADACGLSLRREAEAGQSYPLKDGGSAIVGEGSVYIKLTVAKASDFTSFWNKAKELGYDQQYEKIYRPQ